MSDNIERNLGANEKVVETNSEKCPSCGGDLVFDPKGQSLKCEHCGNTVDLVKNRDIAEHNILDGFKYAEKFSGGELTVYRCENCGATVNIKADETANKCPFCGTAHVVKEGSLDGIKPQVVLPFRFSKHDAASAIEKWAKKRIFAPHAFKKAIDIDYVDGIYEPCFTFDSNTSSHYDGRVGDEYTRTVGSGKDQHTETYVVYRHVRGNYNYVFDDVAIANNDHFDQRSLESLSPFNMDGACVYESKYISGFYAESYQTDLPECWNRAKKKMDKIIRRNIEDSLHCDVVDYLNVFTTHTDVTYKYMLLPVYDAKFRYKGKYYGVKMNGSTARVWGKTPLSPVRISIAILLGAAALVGIGLLIFRLING